LRAARRAGAARSPYTTLFRSVRAAFARAVREHRPDVVLATWAYPDGWAAVRLARAHGLPVVVLVHGSDVRRMDEFPARAAGTREDRKSTRLNSSHVKISYAVF